MTRIDLRKLTADIDRQRTLRPARGSGAMQAIREHLSAIQELRRDGATWDQIAAGLALQGVLRRDGTPMTGRRLTALIDSIARQDRRRAAKLARRRAQPDLMRTPEAAPARLSLSSELLTRSTDKETVPDAEEAIRRQRYELTKSLFKIEE